MNFKKLLVTFVAVMLLMGLTVTASAAEVSADTAPAAAEDWRAARLELLEARLKELVSAGTITQTQADTMLARITERMASCDGTGYGNQSVCDGTGTGIFGGNPGNGQGVSRGAGQGRGMGSGRRGR